MRLKLCLLMLLASATVCFAQKNNTSRTVTVTVINKENKQPVEQTVVMVMPYGLWGITDNTGSAKIKSVPEGKCSIEVSCLGYAPQTIPYDVRGGVELNVILEPTSLSMDEVVVVAKNNKSGESTASIIGRQAIDHLQATSLKDIMQLVPGQIMTQNPTLNSTSSFTSRTLDKYDTNNAFGASIMVDGIPLSNNADLNSKGGSYSTASTGVDLRSVGTDDIESVEIIRGIASAEYGDVSSGTMIVTSKVGVTDLKVRGKIMPGIQQVSIGKGFSLGKSNRYGTLNVNADYAYGKSDPRFQTDTYNRLLASVIHSIGFKNDHIKLTTKISTTNVKDWSGADPDEKVQDVYNQTKENGVTVSHSGLFNLDKLFARTLKYDLSYSYKVTDSYTRTYNSGAQPYFWAEEEGTYTTTLLPNRYLARGGTIGKPVSYYAKVSDSFYLNYKGFKNRFNIGVEFRSEGNNGRGFYNEDPLLPLSLTNNRPRHFYDIPYLTQLVGYVEDNITLRLSKSDYPMIKAQVGLRWTMIQPGRSEQMQSLSPRVNASFVACDWFELRFGMGISEKTPSLNMLYPDRSYFDYMNLNYSNSAGQYLGVYTTRIFDHNSSSLKPMRSTKYEVGFNINTHRGQSFSVTAYIDNVKNGFMSDNSEWVTLAFNKWLTSSVSNVGGELIYDKDNPSSVETMLYNVTRVGNRQVHKSYGIEYDFNLGKIKATNTAFFLNGAYSSTKYYTDNYTYNRPMGSTATYDKVYFIYQGNASNTERRQFSSSLRVVQHIPRLNFIVSGTVQAVLYDYTLTKTLTHKPIGYIIVDEANANITGSSTVKRGVFTAADYADAENVIIGGYKLSDQTFAESAYNNVAETWPPLWVVNLRVTKNITKYLGLSFYVNNVFFSQPWHKSSISASQSERNSNLFSYGCEIDVNF